MVAKLTVPDGQVLALSCQILNQAPLAFSFECQGNAASTVMKILRRNLVKAQIFKLIFSRVLNLLNVNHKKTN